MSTPELAIAKTETDAAEETRPDVVPLGTNETQQVQQAALTVQQQQALLEIAQDRFQAVLWRTATGLGIDLAAYQFDYERAAFVKK